MMSFLLIVLLSYLLGSIPFAFIIARITRGIDIRDYGSGNVGATNVTRVVGRIPGVIVLVMDLLKGIIAVNIISTIYINEIYTMPVDILRATAAVAVVVGHIWPIFLGFSGGKGVATGAGAFLGLSTYPALCSIVLFIIGLQLTKIVSIGSVLASIFFPIFLIIWKVSTPILISGSIISLMVMLKHISNIKRIFNKTETKVI